MAPSRNSVVEAGNAVVAAIGETTRLMGETDKVIDAHGGRPRASVTDKRVELKDA